MLNSETWAGKRKKKKKKFSYSLLPFSRQDHFPNFLDYFPFVNPRTKTHFLFQSAGDNQTAATQRRTITLPPEVFRSTFAYHVIFDEQLVIQQVGDTLERMLGVAVDEKPSMQDAFSVILPRYIRSCRYFIYAIIKYAQNDCLATHC
jgi:hypothetical protein